MLSASSYGHFTAAKEFLSQCHIFRFGNIAYCREIDILIDQNIAYCCEIDTYIDQNIAYCCEIGMFLTKHTVSLQTSVQREALGTHVNLLTPPGGTPGTPSLPDFRKMWATIVVTTRGTSGRRNYLISYVDLSMRTSEENSHTLDRSERVGGLSCR